MIFALLPVKARVHAKQRLADFLSADQREALARVMYEEVLEKLTAARGIDRVVVVTSDRSAAAHARDRGVDVFAEPDQSSHSHSADRAARQAMQMGARTAILLPIDVPLVTSAEIESLAAAAPSQPGVVIVPSADGTGTNALVRTPPDVIRSCFGRDSFRAHLQQARERGIASSVMRPPGIVFDVDTPEDVAELLARAPESRTAALLRAQRPQWASAS